MASEINHRLAARLLLTTTMTKKDIVATAGGDPLNSSRYLNSKTFLATFEEVKQEAIASAAYDRNFLLKKHDEVGVILRKKMQEDEVTANEVARLAEAHTKVNKEMATILGAYAPSKHLRVETDSEGVKSLYKDPIEDAISKAKEIETNATILTEDE